jgi:hypothetical protein
VNSALGGASSLTISQNACLGCITTEFGRQRMVWSSQGYSNAFDAINTPVAFGA